MNAQKQKDFESKKNWLTQMAEFYGWSYWLEDKATGHVQFRKENLILNVWTTKMTVLFQVGNWRKSMYKRSIDSIEKMFEDPHKMFQYPERTWMPKFVNGTNVKSLNLK